MSVLKYFVHNIAATWQFDIKSQVLGTPKYFQALGHKTSSARLWNYTVDERHSSRQYRV